MLKQGLSHAGINRPVSALKAMLNRAVEWDVLDSNPISAVRALKEDKNPEVRYLSDDEENQLEGPHPSIAELDGEAVQARQKLKELNWLAISALEETAEGEDTPRKELSLAAAGDEAR